MTTRQFTPTIGSAVLTMDGDKIGEVKEIQGGYFKVEASMQPDYWLRTSDISSLEGRDVLMSFSADNLGDYKADGPDM